jgi:hypothetical protein
MFGGGGRRLVNENSEPLAGENAKDPFVINIDCYS